MPHMVSGCKSGQSPVYEFTTSRTEIVERAKGTWPAAQASSGWTESSVALQQKRDQTPIML